MPPLDHDCPPHYFDCPLCEVRAPYHKLRDDGICSDCQRTLSETTVAKEKEREVKRTVSETIKRASGIQHGRYWFDRAEKVWVDRETGQRGLLEDLPE